MKGGVIAFEPHSQIAVVCLGVPEPGLQFFPLQDALRDNHVAYDFCRVQIDPPDVDLSVLDPPLYTIRLARPQLIEGR